MKVKKIKLADRGVTKLFWEIVLFQPVPSFGVVWSGPRQQQRVLLAMWGTIGWGLPLPFKMIGKTYMMHVSAQRPRSNLSKCISWSLGYKQGIWVSKIYWVTPFTFSVCTYIYGSCRFTTLIVSARTESDDRPSGAEVLKDWKGYMTKAQSERWP